MGERQGWGRRGWGRLKCACFQPQPSCLLDSEHDVHILYGLADSTFEKVVDARGDEEFVINLITMNERLVCVHYLLEVERLIHIMGERLIFIEVLVARHNRVEVCICLHHLCSEDATREVTTVRDEVDRSIKRTLYLRETLTNLGDVLVLESLVDTEVIGAPGEMCRGTRLYTGTCRTRDRIDTDIVLDQSHLSRRKQTKLDTGGEATGVSDMHRRSDLASVDLRETIDEVVSLRRRMLRVNYLFRSKAEVLSEIDDLDVLRDIMLLHERLALAMTEAEEDDIHLVERQFGGELQVCIAIESFMDIRHVVPGIALTLLAKTISA